MEKMICVFVAFALMAIYICISIYNDIKLRRRTDSLSRVKAEARRRHYEEDRNKRITKDLVPPESPFLWNCREVDDGVLKMLKMEHDTNDE